MMDSNTSYEESVLEDRNPYGFCDRDFSFGVTKSTMYYPKADFGLELSFVTAQQHTGYVCKISREVDQKIE